MTDPAQRPPIERLAYWSLAATNLAIASSVAYLAAAQWRESHVDDALRKEQSHFNRNLVDSIHDLAAQSGILTSADLCPVRFRLRDPSGKLLALEFQVRLHEIGRNGDVVHTALPVTSRKMGLFDFGLLPPGQYRIEIASPQGMTLTHDLTVLPGVPLDRVVYCPGLGTDSVPYTLDVEWTDSVQRNEILVVAQMDPAPFQCDEWVWQPPEEASRAFLLDQNSSRTLKPAEYDAIADLLELPAFRGADAELFNLSPCRYWQISALAFLRRSQSYNSKPLQLLGIAEFGPDSADRARDGIPIDPSWRFPLLTPQFEAGGHQRWTFRLPDELHSLLHESLTLESATGQGAVGNSASALDN
jgi:hypothetical protein